MEEIRIEIENLREKLSHYAKMYYVYDVSDISDFEYVAMFRRLQELEAAYPQFDDVNSPTKRVAQPKTFFVASIYLPLKNYRLFLRMTKKMKQMKKHLYSKKMKK